MTEVLRVLAGNPSPLTLDGTNTWVVGRDPAFVVDPGPALADHVAAVAAACAARGGCAGIALTHDHADHAGALAALRDALGDPPLLAHGAADTLGPLRAVATPGHAVDHLAFLMDDGRCFTGDAVLGTGSVFVAPAPGALRAYLEGLERLRAQGPRVLYPGHGPVVEDAVARIEAMIAHRAEREGRLVAALDAGHRTVSALLDTAWDDAPAVLRPVAAWSLSAHLYKLEEEGRDLEGVERPDPPDWLDGQTTGA